MLQLLPLPHPKAPPLAPTAQEDERNVVDLMTDQLEFADVVLINKADLVPKSQLDVVGGVVRKLNPSAKVIITTNSNVDLKQVPLATHDTTPVWR